MYIVKGLNSQSEKVTFLYVFVTDLKSCISRAENDGLYDLTLIQYVDIYKAFKTVGEQDTKKWYLATLKRNNLSETETEDKKTRSKTYSVLILADDTQEVTEYLNSRTETNIDEIIKISCTKFDEVVY